MHHHSVLWKSQDSFAKKCWDPPLCHIRGNTCQADQHHWNLQNYTVQGSKTGGEKNLWLDWSSISTCISNQRKSFSFAKADFLHSSGNWCSRIYFCHWLPRTLTLHFPICPQNSSCLKNVRTSLQITMHGVWSKGKCTVAAVSISIAPQYFKCLAFLPERQSYE